MSKRRPEIYFPDERNVSNDWRAAGKVLDGIAPVDDFPLITIHVDHPNATDWDCYLDGGMGGTYSKKFLDIVGRNSLRYFTILPVLLNGNEYFVFRCEKRFDCVDISRSVYKTFPSNPSIIMRILHFEFIEANVPRDVFFRTTISNELLLTESLADRIKDSDLNGIEIALLP